MPVPVEPVSWTGSLVWLLVLLAASFLVSWLAGGRLQLPRTPYIAVLLVVTVALSAGYRTWLGVDAETALTARWGWWLLVGAVTGFGITRFPATLLRTGAHRRAAFAWEGVAYGIAEGLLLSALPAFMAWQTVHALGWSGPGAALARWTLPMLASVAVIVVHHLGYWEYRSLRALAPVVVGCGLLTVAYLVTASVFAPVLGHVIMHMAAVGHGTELPPHPHDAVPASPQAGPLAAAGRS